jgi:hypothetical protein
MSLNSGGARGSGGQLPPGASERGRQKWVVKNFFDDATSEGGDRGVARGSDFPRPPLGGLRPQSKLNTPNKNSHTPPTGGGGAVCHYAIVWIKQFCVQLI